MSANPQERKQTLMIAERGMVMKVQQDALIIAKGQHILHRLVKGQQEVRCILFLSNSQADMFLDALTWCSQEAICVRVSSPDGKHLYSATSSICSDVERTENIP